MSYDMSYRNAEALRKARWILNHPYDYTNAEIKRAKAIVKRLG